MKLMKLIEMNRSEERELFLKYLAHLYLHNPNLPISFDTIYCELSRFSIYGGENYTIDGDSLVGVQVGLNNKFRINSKVNTFSNGYFWAIENRCNKKDSVFYSELRNSVKLYVSVDSDNIYRVSEALFNFMINEGIVMQSKIAKEMRNDALVCRVSTSEDVIKVSEFLNKLNYKSNVKPNPFLLDNGKVSLTMDGGLSYNNTLAKLLKQYFDLKRNKKQLNSVNCDDFNLFVKSQIDMLNGEQKIYFMDLYDISDYQKYKDFLMICNLISKNLDNTLSLEQLFEYANVSNISVDSVKDKYLKQDEDKILYVINSLANYSSVDDVHNIIMKFIETGNVKYFTRRDNIRAVISDNFTPQNVKNIISNLGYNAFISVSKVTYDKYGEEQLYAAVNDLFNDNGIRKFTNDYGARSCLGLVIPSELLKDVLISKLNENGMSISSISLATLVLEEINMLEEKQNILGK